MEDRRVYVDPSHHVRQKKVFAALIVLGLGLVLAVWFLQLRTMLNREVVVDEFQKDLATFGQDIEGTWDSSAAGLIAEEDIDTATSAISDAMQDELNKQQAQEALAQEMVTRLQQGADDTSAETTTTTLPTSDAVSE